MKNIVVVTPTEQESRLFMAHGIRVLHCGVGMAECAAVTAHLIVKSKPDLMVLAGIAGAYSDRVEIGETVVVARETIADLGRYSGGGFTPLFQKTYTSSAPVPRGFKAVRSYTVNTAGAMIAEPVEAEIENMEGAAFFAVCRHAGVPAMEVRTISNRVGEAISSMNMAIATHRLALDLEKIIKHEKEKTLL